MRGLPLETTGSNLDQIIQMLQAAGSKVLLAGMTLPPNYGGDYITRFGQIYANLAKKYNVPRIPFLLSDVVFRTGLMQQDGIHPTAQGNEIVAKTVMRYLKPLLLLRVRRFRNSAVAARWHLRHRVRMFSRSHSPPPSTTGRI